MRNYVILLMISIIFIGCKAANRSDSTAGTGFTAYYPTNGVNHPNTDFLYPHYVFDMEALPHIIISVTSNQWNTLLTNFDANWNNEEMVHADFMFIKDDETNILTNVGFRVRGGSSRRRPEEDWGELHDSADPNWNHCHFKLDFEEYADDNEFYGLEGLNLKWHKDDPNYCREIYCYNLFSRFGVWTAPRVSYTRLTIDIIEDDNPAYYGVYMMLEPLDDEFIKDRFTDREVGYLWKSKWGASMKEWGPDKSFGVEDIHPTDDDLSYEPTYDLKTSKSELESARDLYQNFIYQLNKLEGDEFEEWIASAFDVDLFLKTLAVHVSVGMWDDYWINNGNNYYFYFDKGGRAYYVPYDYDNTLGINMTYFTENTGTQSVIEWGPSDSKRPLVQKILAVDKYFTDYTNYLYELVNPENDYFFFSASTNRIRKWMNMIDPYIENDTEEDMKILDWSFTSWADLDFYRLLDGDNSGNAKKKPGANYFLTRYTSIVEELGFDLPIYEGNTDAEFPSWEEIFSTSLYFNADLGFVNPEVTEDTLIFRVINDDHDIILIRGGFTSWGMDYPKVEFTNVATNLYAAEVDRDLIGMGDGYYFYNEIKDSWDQDPACRFTAGAPWYESVVTWDE